MILGGACRPGSCKHEGPDLQTSLTVRWVERWPWRPQGRSGEVGRDQIMQALWVGSRS